MKSGNSWCYSIQTLLSSRLLYKNLKIKIYKTIILPVVLHGCETRSLTLTEDCRLRVFENRILRQTFVLSRGESGEQRRNFIVLYCSPNTVRLIKSKRLRKGAHVSRMEECRSSFKR